MSQVFIVFEPPSDPYAGAGYIVAVFESESLCLEFIGLHNSECDYEYEKYYYETYEIERGI